MATAASALRKLQSGQALTNEEKKLLGMSTTTTTTASVFAPTGNTFTDTLNQLRAARGITPENVNASGQLDAKGLTADRLAQAQAVAAKPVMSQEQIDGGGVVKWVGGVDGEYQIIMPIGSPLVGSKAAGWEPGRNNLAGQPTGTTTTNPTTTTVTTNPTTTVVTTNPTTTVTTVIPDRPIGTPLAFVYDPVSKTYKMPAKPTEAGNWVWDNNAGWTNTLVNPGSTGFETGSEKTLAIDTFKNTLALYFGAKEMSQPWANALFKTVSSYYKSGSTIDESLNLALQDARNKPELKPFTDRFAGVFALQDRRAKGEAVDVPTIAEFFKTQETIGERLREVGLGDIATNEILGEVLGTGKSAAAVLNLVNDVFMTIDNAPEQLKKDLQAVAPGIDRTSIAKALLLGKRGADELQKQIKEVSVLSAAKSQGVTIGNELAADIAARNFDYGTSLTNFGTVAKGAPDLQKLTEISTGQAVKPVSAQESIIKSLFQQDVKEQERIRLEAEKEAARFAGGSGTFGSRSLASRNRANRVI
jgi:glycosyltransferase A (GT-A) superfamily protein (DUF2064 family)